MCVSVHASARVCVGWRANVLGSISCWFRGAPASLEGIDAVGFSIMCVICMCTFEELRMIVHEGTLALVSRNLCCVSLWSVFSLMWCWSCTVSVWLLLDLSWVKTLKVQQRELFFIMWMPAMWFASVVLSPWRRLNSCTLRLCRLHHMFSGYGCRYCINCVCITS